jgi:tRNA (cytosine40_48-C5)-methyltransferase
LKTLTFPQNEEVRILSEKYGYAPWVVARFLQYVPDPLIFLSKMEHSPAKYIRINTLKTTVEILSRRLSEKGFTLTSTFLPWVYSVSGGSPGIGATSEYMLGHYYIQDLSSCVAVEALDLTPEIRVLEVGASPGGKTTLMAQKMQNTGCIVALEPNNKRIRALEFNLSRMGISNACVSKLDGLDVASFGSNFDRVLLDAPCSCEGVIAKDRDRKTSRDPEDIDFCSARQLKLIEAAAGVVKPGGSLVYSTCSFAPEENEAVVSHLLDKFSDMYVEPLPYGSKGLTEFAGIKFNEQVELTRRFYPHRDDTSGFFVARIRKEHRS